MSDKDPKLWESTFGEDSDAEKEEQLSRVRQKKSQHSNKLLVWSLFIILLVVMFLPIIGQKFSANHDKSSIDSVNQVAVSSKTKKAFKPKAKKQKAKKVVSKLDEQKKPAEANQVTKPDENQAQAQQQQSQVSEQNNQQQQQPAAASQNQQDAGQYYVVQARDNAYRIALNHGLTTAQLYQLHGISSGTVLRPGMQLRVK
jgi:outer membrane biosynthesis protein TonB